jgi:hypothetical protein
MLETPIEKGVPVARSHGSALAWLLARSTAPRARSGADAVPAAAPCARDARSRSTADGPSKAWMDPSPEGAYTPHPCRANAHAAFASVVGGGPRALDAALAVVEAEARAIRLRLMAQEEALKLLRLYASDQWARSVAQQALGPADTQLAPCLPGYLYDPTLADTRPCTCGDLR